MKRRILVAMSGGVDSSVAAALLQEQGCAIEGAYMKNWINEDNILGDCPWQQDIEDAAAVAEQLGIPFRVVNLMDAYRSRVVDYLLAGYQQGVTPNPDVMCNREIKFGVFRDYARAEGFDQVATGHYARIARETDGRARLLRGRDPGKDQSYFLALMRQEQLRDALFPVGELLKAEVRERAAQFGLVNAGKKDSQGICFIGQVKMSDFLRTYVPDAPGDIRDRQDRVLGRHRGLHLYTLGQRKGLGVASNTPNEAYVVVEKRPEENALIVGFDRLETPGLYASRVTLSGLSYPCDELPDRCEVTARPRYRAPLSPATFQRTSDDSAELTFHEPQRALTPGQICALHQGEELVAGAIFAEIHSAIAREPVDV